MKTNKVSMFVRGGDFGRKKNIIDDNVLRWNDEFARIAAIEKPADNWTKALKAISDSGGLSSHAIRRRLSNYYSATEEEEEIASAFLLSGLEYAMVVFDLDKNDVAEVTTSIYSRRWKPTGKAPIEWTLYVRFANDIPTFEKGKKEGKEEGNTVYLDLELAFKQRKRTVEFAGVHARSHLDFDIPDFLGCNTQLMIGGQPYKGRNELSSGSVGNRLNAEDLIVKNYKNIILASKLCNSKAATDTFKGFKLSMESTQLSLVKGTLLSLSGIKNESAEVIRTGDKEVQIGIVSPYGSSSDVFIIKF